MSHLKAELAERHFLPKDASPSLTSDPEMQRPARCGGGERGASRRKVSVIFDTDGQRCFFSQKAWTVEMNRESSAYVLIVNYVN